MEIRRQYVYWVNLDPTIGNEIQKKRPCLVISSDLYNRIIELATVVPITDNSSGKVRSTEVHIPASENCVTKDSKVKADQLRTISKIRIDSEIGRLSDSKFNEVKAIIKRHLNIN